MLNTRKKPDLLIIHGLLGALDCLDHVASLIANVQARTIHLLGYGLNQESTTTAVTLAAQAEHAAKMIEDFGWKRTWILGHSVGGAVSMLLADQRPDLVQAVINIEGNFTLKDAFWSGRIAAMPLAQWSQEFQLMQSDSAAWLRTNDIEVTLQRMEWATAMLQHEQPAATIHNMARAVIAETSPPGYLEMIRRVIDRGTPIHLLAGENSAAGWDIPDWVRSKAASYREIPKTGHMMMLEDPAAFCRCVDLIMRDHAP